MEWFRSEDVSKPLKYCPHHCWQYHTYTEFIYWGRLNCFLAPHDGRFWGQITLDLWRINMVLNTGRPPNLYPLPVPSHHQLPGSSTWAYLWWVSHWVSSWVTLLSRIFTEEINLIPSTLSYILYLRVFCYFRNYMNIRKAQCNVSKVKLIGKEEESVVGGGEGKGWEYRGGGYDGRRGFIPTLPRF